MLLALFADIHANRQAFSACLEAARARGAERLILLGDFVGYGGDPEWTVDTVMALVAQGAIASPPRWRYVQSTADAARSMISTSAPISFCGHIHLPTLYSMSVTAKMTGFVPTPGMPVQLLKGRQWLAVAGSVGQPRDHNPAACFLTFNTQSRELTYCRRLRHRGRRPAHPRQRPAGPARRSPVRRQVGRWSSPWSRAALFSMAS